jgi:hypothetical protein
MKVTDWRGNAYTIGDTVLYPRMSGRSCEMAEATVADIWLTYTSPETYKWVRLKEGQEPPIVWHSGMGENPEDPTGPNIWQRREAPAKTELRVRLQPNGRGSRDFYRADSVFLRDENGSMIRDEDDRAVRVQVPIKPVTLTVVENVTWLSSHA